MTLCLVPNLLDSREPIDPPGHGQRTLPVGPAGGNLVPDLRRLAVRLLGRWAAGLLVPPRAQLVAKTADGLALLPFG